MITVPHASHDTELLAAWMQVQQLEAAAEEALDTDSWVDCLPLVPSVLTTEDAVELLGRVPAVQQLGNSPALSLVICGSMPCSGVSLILLVSPLCVGRRTARM